MVDHTGRWMSVMAAAVGASLAFAAPCAQAQVQTIDPNTAIDSDLNRAPRAAPATMPQPPVAPQQPSIEPAPPLGASVPPAVVANDRVGGPTAVPASGDATYHENELVNAAEGVFGKGARGLALIIRDLLKKQGEPDGYITGNEGGGAVVVGLRYGSGTLHHKIEGQMPVYWTGPSVGFDFGGSVGSTFVLIYNMHDTDQLFHRIGAGEGQAYLLGGFNVSYLRRGDLVVIPVRMGGGLRLGVNAGYMNFTHKLKRIPF